MAAAPATALSSRAPRRATRDPGNSRRGAGNRHSMRTPRRSAAGDRAGRRPHDYALAAGDRPAPRPKSCQSWGPARVMRQNVSARSEPRSIGATTRSMSASAPPRAAGRVRRRLHDRRGRGRDRGQPRRDRRADHQESMMSRRPAADGQGRLGMLEPLREYQPRALSDAIRSRRLKSSATAATPRTGRGDKPIRSCEPAQAVSTTRSRGRQLSCSTGVRPPPRSR